MLGLRHEFLYSSVAGLSRMREYRALHGGPFYLLFVRACACVLHGYSTVLNWEKALYGRFDLLRDLLHCFASPSLHS